MAYEQPMPVEPGWFHAIAVDYDGTLTTGERPGPDVLAALAHTRRQGRHVVLVTGRILAELRASFPEVDSHVDMIVGENGAVLSRGGVDRALTAPVPGSLAARLRDLGIPHREGMVLLASHAAHEGAILIEIRRLGLECQLIRNRSELMVLPAGISKGSGLFEGLGELGISRHNTVAIGDAENDHSLLDVAELGVAVGNAVGALKERADIVLPGADGDGVVQFLHGPLFEGRERVHPRRSRIELGTSTTGDVASIPASQLNVLLVGTPHSGKSYLAGLVAERLIAAGYSVVVLDPEGDHVGLGGKRGVIIVGRGMAPPPPAALVDLIRNLFASVVVDLTGLPRSERAGYSRAALAEVARLRRSTGLPHWVIVDEAHDVFGVDGPLADLIGTGGTGYCLATHRPDELSRDVIAGIDLVIATPHDDPGLRADLLRSAGASPNTTTSSATPHGHAVIVDRAGRDADISFRLGERTTSHLRHWHKYAMGGLSPHRRFHFRTDWDTATGATAGSIAEFAHELRIAEQRVIVHHCLRHDFSRWLEEVIGDAQLASCLRTAESDLAGNRTDAETARRAIGIAIALRCPS